MYKVITASELISLREKFPDENLISIDPDVANHKQNKNKSFPTTYLPLYIKRLDGKNTKLNFKFVSQLLCSGAKLPAGTKEEDTKHLSIMFRKLAEEDLASTNYQSGDYKKLIKHNEEMVQALDIIAEEYLKCIKCLIKDTKVIKKKKAQQFNIKQSVREPTTEETAADDDRIDTDGKIKLPYSLFRLKLPVHYETRELSYSMSKDKPAEPYVFDVTKRVPKGDAVPARFKTKGKNGKKKYEKLDVFNASKVITYMSLAAGTVNFDSICLSKSGISLSNKITSLHIMKHKAIKEPNIDEDDFYDMGKFKMNDDSDSDDDGDKPPEDKDSDEDTDEDVDDDANEDIEDVDGEPKDNQSDSE